MWYKGNKQYCEAYDALVCEGEGYTGDKTLCWSKPIKKHDEDVYIVKKHDSYTEQSGNLELINEIPSNWYPPMEI